jgi:hypothetical protein
VLYSTGDVEDCTVNDARVEQVIAIQNVTPILLYPTFFKILASDDIHVISNKRSQAVVTCL